MKQTSTTVLLFILASLTAVCFSNCSGFLAGQSASFGSEEGVRTESLLADATPQTYIPPPLTFGPSYTVPVETTCSDYGSATLNGNIVRSTTSIAITLTEKTSGANCTYSDQMLRDHLMGEQKLVIPPLKQICPLLDIGTYTVKLIGNGSSANLLAGSPDPIAIRMGGAPAFEISVTRDEYGNLAMNPAPTMNGIKPSVLMGANTAGTDVTVGSPPTGTDLLCAHRASPLLVQLHPGTSQVQKIELTPQSRGVMFDIQGRHAIPAFTKRLISWFTPETVQGNYFIVLPDANGNVTGVDQLFGDNTTGPDGAFAANGYEALRKWDGRRADGSFDSSARDGQITARDPVFSKLRLWMDSHSDGIA
ncbi:MAG: hypothetical protein ACXVA9_05910, partial [Bdellovibrionales bacterium]